MELHLNKSKYNSKEFKELWQRINAKSAYVVDFETDELVRKSVDALNEKLRVTKIFFKVAQGSLDKIKSKEQLEAGNAFKLDSTESRAAVATANSSVKYDLIGKIVEDTKLTRKTVGEILSKIQMSDDTLIRDCLELFDVKLVMVNSLHPDAAFRTIEENGIEGRFIDDDSRVYPAHSIWRIIDILKSSSVTNYRYNFVTRKI